jgi:carbon storage regulator
MLVLGRKQGQKIKIGHHITVQILECNSKYIYIGIDAPKDIEVYREEIYERIYGSKPLAKDKDPNLFDPSIPKERILEV